MKIKLFTQLLQRFRPDLRRWPERNRRKPEALLADSAAAPEQGETATELDRLFGLRRASVEQSLRATLGVRSDSVLRSLRVLPERPPHWRWLISKPVGAVWAVGLLAGVIAGLIVPAESPPGRADGVPIITALLGDSANPLGGSP